MRQKYDELNKELSSHSSNMAECLKDLKINEIEPLCKKHNSILTDVIADSDDLVVVVTDLDSSLVKQLTRLFGEECEISHIDGDKFYLVWRLSG